MADQQTDEWYFDLRKGVAVTSDQRGPGDHMLGPYPTKGQAENWKATKDARNEAWDEDDQRWHDPGNGSAAPGRD